jgi:hypothetical protein
MSIDGAEDDNVSLHSAHTGITNRTSKTAPCLVPGTDDVITSGVCYLSVFSAFFWYDDAYTFFSAYCMMNMMI